MSDNLITKDTKISDIIKICPNAPAIFNKHGMGCFACMASSAETIEEGAQMHDIDPDIILNELNSVCQSSDNN